MDFRLNQSILLSIIFEKRKKEETCLNLSSNSKSRHRLRIQSVSKWLIRLSWEKTRFQVLVLTNIYQGLTYFLEIVPPSVVLDFRESPVTSLGMASDEVGDDVGGIPLREISRGSSTLSLHESASRVSDAPPPPSSENGREEECGMCVEAALWLTHFHQTPSHWRTGGPSSSPAHPPPTIQGDGQASLDLFLQNEPIPQFKIFYKPDLGLIRIQNYTNHAFLIFGFRKEKRKLWMNTQLTFSNHFLYFQLYLFQFAIELSLYYISSIRGFFCTGEEA